MALMPEAVADRPVGTVAARARPRVDPALMLGVLMLASLALLLYVGRHLTFFFDEWTFILTRRGGSVATYLDPHNGHLSLVPVVIYKILFKLFGLRHYTPYRIVVVVLHLACCGLLYVLARRRVGAWAALAPATLLLFMGTAYQDLLWPFQTGYLGSIAAGLGSLVLLDRPPARMVEPRSDIGAAALLALSVASSGVGIPFVLACAALLIVQRAPWRQLWIVVAPLVLYGAWYVGWGGGEQTTTTAILGAPQYVADAAAGAVAGIAGLNDATWGPPLAVALLFAAAIGWRASGRGGPRPMLMAAVIGAIVFWVLTAIARADVAEPAASRYLYVGAVFILLALSELRLGLALRGGWLGLTGLLIAGAIVANIGALRIGQRGLHAADLFTQASLAAVDVAGPLASPAFIPDPKDAPQITVGPYRAAVRALGSPAFTVSELQKTLETVREHADSVLVHAEQLSAVPAAGVTPAGRRPIPVEAAFGARVGARAGCSTVLPTSALASVDFRVAPGTLLTVRIAGDSGNLYLRRFGSNFTGLPWATVSGRQAVDARFPPDGAPAIQWRVQLVTSQSATVCAS